MKKPTLSGASLENIQAFLDESWGQIAIGEIPPIRSAALAAEGKKVRVALVRREKKTVSELLPRLDVTLGRALADNMAADEVTPEIKRRRSP